MAITYVEFTLLVMEIFFSNFQIKGGIRASKNPFLEHAGILRTNSVKRKIS